MFFPVTGQIRVFARLRILSFVVCCKASKLANFSWERTSNDLMSRPRRSTFPLSDAIRTRHGLITNPTSTQSVNPTSTYIPTASITLTKTITFNPTFTPKPELKNGSTWVRPADEMVMVLNGFDTDFDAENNFYAANTIPFYYQHHPIQINSGQLIRIYVVNMVEFDPINNFHLHGNLYKYYPTGTDTVPSFYTDMITLSQTERGIMEFQYDSPGKYLFHAHKVEFSEKGWVGLFLVKDNSRTES